MVSAATLHTVYAWIGAEDSGDEFNVDDETDHVTVSARVHTRRGTTLNPVRRSVLTLDIGTDKANADDVRDGG